MFFLSFFWPLYSLIEMLTLKVKTFLNKPKEGGKNEGEMSHWNYIRAQIQHNTHCILLTQPPPSVLYERTCK